MNRRRRKKLQRSLVAACEWGSPQRIAALLRAGADPGMPDGDGTTPLYRASVQGRADVVRVLAAAGADPDAESGHGDEGLPLCAAACWGHVDAVAALLDAGADPMRREDRGQGHDAGHWAEVGGHHRTLALLRREREPQGPLVHPAPDSAPVLKDLGPVGTYPGDKADRAGRAP
ncbi:MAG TPA: ankyrin repeat domain-containing protein [Actinoplanes sp.]|nr:ankyrin repeat domain-containing protein [Actinoplanes sp.]